MSDASYVSPGLGRYEILLRSDVTIERKQAATKRGPTFATVTICPVGRRDKTALQISMSLLQAVAENARK